ncbi:MAG: hypothetical protein K6D96_08295 [Acetatifactor sp.]|nr:hypothetical protein [Acetatifactor sp.]
MKTENERTVEKPSLCKGIKKLLTMQEGPSPHNSPKQKPVAFINFRVIEGVFQLFSRKVKASATLEASVVLPILMLFVFSISLVFDLLKNEAATACAMRDGLRMLAVEEAVAGENYAVREVFMNAKLSGEYLAFVSPAKGDLIDVTAVKPFFFRSNLLLIQPFLVGNRMVIKNYTGYRINKDVKPVYITETGTVYHEDPDCTYIRLSVKEVSFTDGKNAKNDEGERYVKCRVCGKGKAPERVYITDEGNCLHYKRECSSLKRTVREVNLYDIEGYRPCSRCCGRE